MKMHKNSLKISTIIFLFLCVSSSAFAAPNDFVKAYAAQAKLNEQQAESQIRSVFAAIENELKAGRAVTIEKFGRFHVVLKNPSQSKKAGATEAKPAIAKKYPRFSSADALKISVNQK